MSSKLNKARYRLIFFAAAILTVIILVAILILLPVKYIAKEDISEYYKQYEFLRLDKNHIVFTSDQEERDLKECLSRVEKEDAPLKILHIGDSHIQADFFTGETRRLLSAWLDKNYTARGFTFPYHIIGSNNPDDYKVTWSGIWKRNRIGDDHNPKLGVAGISMQTTETASEFEVSLNSPWSLYQTFDMVNIFYDCTNSSVIPYLKEESELVHQSLYSVTYQFTKPLSSFSVGISWEDNQEDVFNLYGFNLINSKSRVKYHAAGVNGATVTTFLKSANFERQLALLNPQIVIISIGTNDAYNNSFSSSHFRSNLKELVRRVKKSKENPIVILSTPGNHLVDKHKTNPMLRKVQHDIKKVAKQTECGVWDFYEVMGGDGSIEKWYLAGLSAHDKLHLNRKGYKLQGNLLFDALLKFTGVNPAKIEREQMFGDE